MKARIYKDKDFKTIKDWWDKCPGPVDFTNAKTFLSDTGIIISDKGKDICACWLYVGNTDIAQLGWFISDVKHDKQDEAINYLIKISKRYIRRAGYKGIMVYTENTGIKNKLLDIGFIVGDIDIKQMIGGL